MVAAAGKVERRVWPGLKRKSSGLKPKTRLKPVEKMGHRARPNGRSRVGGPISSHDGDESMGAMSEGKEETGKQNQRQRQSRIWIWWPGGARMVAMLSTRQTERLRGLSGGSAQRGSRRAGHNVVAQPETEGWGRRMGKASPVPNAQSKEGREEKRCSGWGVDRRRRSSTRVVDGRRRSLIRGFG
jgi:hypothetical protein